MTSEVVPLDTRGPKRLWQQGPGFVIRRRGATDEPVTLEYLCPVHGRFGARVSKTDTPDEMACPRRLTVIESVGLYETTSQDGKYCGLTSPWSPSTVGVWKSAGEVAG
jgi:hypothetical protein